MSKDDSNDLEYSHDKGGQDRAEGNAYTPSHGFLGGLLSIKYEDERRDAHEAGCDIADNQDRDD